MSGDPQGFLAENFPRIAACLADIRMEAHYLLIGATVARDSIAPSDILKTFIAIGLSAFGSAYLTTERTSVKVDQYAQAQSEFRQEMRQFMREQAVEIAGLRDRMARTETVIERGQQPQRPEARPR